MMAQHLLGETENKRYFHHFAGVVNKKSILMIKSTISPLLFFLSICCFLESFYYPPGLRLCLAAFVKAYTDSV